MEKIVKAKNNLSELINNHRQMGIPVSGLEEVEQQLRDYLTNNKL